MSNYHRGIATGILILILAGITLLGGATVGVIKYARQDATTQCPGGVCPTATSTEPFPEADWAPRASDVCGDSICGPSEATNTALCPADCVEREELVGPAPTITFTAKPASLPSTGGTAVLTWSTTDATSCASSATPGKNSAWFFAGAPSGVTNVSLGSTSKTYAITCSGPGGSAQKSVTIAVAPVEKKKVVYTPTYKTPTLTISPTSAKISYGQEALFSWKTSYATSCTGTGPWSDMTFGTTDTKYTTSLFESAIMELTCVGQGGTVTKKASVTVADAKGCYFGASTVANGASETAYQASSVSYGKSCVSETRTCTNGSLSGSYAYSSCTVAEPTSCVTPWYETVKDSASVTAYQSSTVDYGESCASETRTCSNGTLSGSYTKSSCSVADAGDCYSSQFGTIPHGTSVTAYKSSSVSYDSSCTSETRTCTDSVLSGSYAYTDCTAGEAKDCSIEGEPLGHGKSVTAYKASSVSYGQQCESTSVTCSNGVYSPLGYSYFSCTVGNPPVPTVSLSASPTSVSAGGSINLTWTTTDKPTSCSLSGPTPRSLSGVSGSSTTVTAPTTEGTYTYSMTCTGAGGTSTASSVSITVTDPYLVNSKHKQSECTTDGNGGSVYTDAGSHTFCKFPLASCPTYTDGRTNWTQYSTWTTTSWTSTKCTPSPSSHSFSTTAVETCSYISGSHGCGFLNTNSCDDYATASASIIEIGCY